MQFFIMLIIGLLSKETFTARLGRIFGKYPENDIIGAPANFFSFLAPPTQLEDAEAQKNSPAMLSFPASFLLIDPNPVPNPNGESRVFGALFALRTLANRGSIHINTPVNLTNINSNTTPLGAASTPTPIAMDVTRIIPYDTSSDGFYDNRNQNLNSDVNVDALPVRIVRRRRPIRQHFSNPFARFSRIQYLR